MEKRVIIMLNHIHVLMGQWKFASLGFIRLITPPFLASFSSTWHHFAAYNVDNWNFISYFSRILENRRSEGVRKACELIHVWWFGFNRIKIWIMPCMNSHMLLLLLLHSLFFFYFTLQTCYLHFALVLFNILLSLYDARTHSDQTDWVCLQSPRILNVLWDVFSVFTVQCTFLWQLDCTSVVASSENFDLNLDLNVAMPDFLPLICFRFSGVIILFKIRLKR